MLLSEGSVRTASRKFGLSSPAMSQTLTQLRTMTGNPLLVRAGRGLVPTPRAIAIRDQIHSLVRDARDVLGLQAREIDVAVIDRTFTIQAAS